jgi:cathepsin B
MDAPDCDYHKFCVSSSGHLLALNTTSSMGTADPNVKLHISQQINVVNFTATPDSSFFQLPISKDDCVDLTTQSVTSLAAEQAYAHAPDTLVNDPQRIRALNVEAEEVGWIAGTNAFFDNWTNFNSSILTQADWKFGPLDLAEHYNQVQTDDDSNIPASFDSRTEWPDCKSISQIRNQGQCGSCWAFAAIEALADRFCITGSSNDVELSAQYAMGCDDDSNACNGGYIDQIWEYLRDHGTTTETCDPYKHCKDPSSINCGGASPPAPPGTKEGCETKCSDGTSISSDNLYRASSAYMVSMPSDVKGIQSEIIKHGPIEVGYFVFSDFQNYQSGVYKRTPSAQVTGKHAVKLVGWGSERNVDYWIVANSWSPTWGENGFFRIARGTNECGIESVPAAGLPKTK